MKKVIEIGNKEVLLDNNASWTMEYRDQFGKDIVPVMMPIISSLVESVSTVISETGKTEVTVTEIAEALQGRASEIFIPMFQLEFVDVIINVTWAMAKAADDDILPPKQWIKGFDEFPLDVVCPAISELILKGFVSSKNLKRLKGVGNSLKNLQPKTEQSLSTTSSSPVLSEA